MKMRSASVLPLVLSLLGLAACEVIGARYQEVVISRPSGLIMQQIDSHLSSGDSEVRFKCFLSYVSPNSPADCTVRLYSRGDTPLDVEMINRPFDGSLLLMRVTGGSQEFQGALYAGLGEQTTTERIEGSLTERSLKLDDNQLSIRCTATRDAQPAYQCWTLVGAKLLRASR